VVASSGVDVRSEWSAKARTGLEVPSPVNSMFFVNVASSGNPSLVLCLAAALLSARHRQGRLSQPRYAPWNRSAPEHLKWKSSFLILKTLCPMCLLLTKVQCYYITGIETTEFPFNLLSGHVLSLDNGVS
jgi:hypothetical protein